MNASLPRPASGPVATGEVGGEMLAALQSIKETCRSEPRNNEAAAVRISLLVRRIGELSSTDSVIRDGNWVISRAFDRYSPVDNTNKMVRAARLHAAVAR